MPTAAPKPCMQCGVLVRDGSTRCEAHKTRAGTFADRQRGTRQQRGYGSAWDALRARILARDAGLCQPSRRHGLFVRATHVDHIVPKAQGGTDDEDNLQAISKPVHQAKTAAEARGQAWDEAAWFAQQQGPTAGQGRGGQISGAAPGRTDRFVEFSRAGVSGGGYPDEVPV